ncbi:MAG: hypothetical protein ACP5KN_19565 [Armatimonadota bacterium]
MQCDGGVTRIFRYRMSPTGWAMGGLFMALTIPVAAYWPSSVAWVTDTPGAVLLFPLALALLSLPILDLLWVIRGRVVVTDHELVWRTPLKEQRLPLADIAAVGRPSEDWRRREDLRLHLVTSDGYGFLHGHQLPERSDLTETIARRAGLSEEVVVRRHTFFTRADWREAVVKLADSKVFRNTALQWSFWVPSDLKPDKGKFPWE